MTLIQHSRNSIHSYFRSFDIEWFYWISSEDHEWRSSNVIQIFLKKLFLLGLNPYQQTRSMSDIMKKPSFIKYWLILYFTKRGFGLSNCQRFCPWELNYSSYLLIICRTIKEKVFCKYISYSTQGKLFCGNPFWNMIEHTSTKQLN